MTNPDDPAFTQQHKSVDKNLNYGLTKREYFAAMAMQGLLANHGFLKFIDDEAIKQNGKTSEGLADAVIQFSNALIDQLNKNAKPRE